MPPKLIALGVIVIVLSMMMTQDRTQHSADAGDFASSSAMTMVAGPWGVEFTKPSGQGCG